MSKSPKQLPHFTEKNRNKCGHYQEYPLSNLLCYYPFLMFTLHKSGTRRLLFVYKINIANIYSYTFIVQQEEFEDTKGVIRIRKSKKDRQHNDQKKKDKRTTNDLQSTTPY